MITERRRATRIALFGGVARGTAAAVMNELRSLPVPSTSWSSTRPT